jgi:hypothetical protein
MRSSSVILEVHNNLLYSKAYLQKYGAIPPAEIVGTSYCKTTFEDERTNHLIIQTCTPHIDTET